MPFNCTRFLNLYSNCAFLKSICNGKMAEECDKCITANDVDAVCKNTVFIYMIIALCLLMFLVGTILYQIIIKKYFYSPYLVKHIIIRDEYILVNDLEIKEEIKKYNKDD